jgi:hypothetical protein
MRSAVPPLPAKRQTHRGGLSSTEMVTLVMRSFFHFDVAQRHPGTTEGVGLKL